MARMLVVLTCDSAGFFREDFEVFYTELYNRKTKKEDTILEDKMSQ